MKTALTFLILTCLLQRFSDAQMGHRVLQRCCSSVSQICVHENAVKSITRSNCGVGAILVKPKKGRMVCLDRDWDWAQKLLKKLTSQDAEAKQMKLDYSKCQ